VTIANTTHKDNTANSAFHSSIAIHRKIFRALTCADLVTAILLDRLMMAFATQFLTLKVKSKLALAIAKHMSREDAVTSARKATGISLSRIQMAAKSVRATHWELSTILAVTSTAENVLASDW
jgi:hypothetical protein